MSDIVSVRRSYGTLAKEEQFDGYSKVVIVVDEDSGIEYSAGTDTGRTLTLTCPFGTQKMADDILAKIRGHQYQPYSATGAHIDPATEIGDGITVGGVYGGVFAKDVTHGSMYTANVSAPGGEKINYKYEYKTTTDRKIQRQYKEMQATFAVQASQIAAEVSARETQGNELRASLNIQADSISQEVSDRKAQGNELRASLNIQADRISQEVSDRKAQGNELRASLNIQEDRISQEVSDRKAQGEQFQSQFQMQTIQISAKVSKTGGNGSSFEWTHDDNKIIYKANGSEVFRIDASGAKVTGEIRATSGKIGGFDIKPNYLSYNGQTWGGTNTTGAYLGTSGLQLGKNFKVDMQGNLNANSGTFAGTVHAGNIDYGGDAGYFSGSGLSGGSVYGSKIAGSTLGTSKFTGGVNTSLGYADMAGGIFGGWQEFTAMGGRRLTIKDRLYVQGKTILFATTTVQTDSGLKSMNLVTWYPGIL